MWSCPKSQKNTATSQPPELYTDYSLARVSSHKKYMYPVQGLIENKSSAARKQNIRRVNLRVNLRLKTFISFFPERTLLQIFRMHKQNPLSENTHCKTSLLNYLHYSPIFVASLVWNLCIIRINININAD